MRHSASTPSGVGTNRQTSGAAGASDFSAVWVFAGVRDSCAFVADAGGCCRGTTIVDGHEGKICLRDTAGKMHGGRTRVGKGTDRNSRVERQRDWCRRSGGSRAGVLQCAVTAVTSLCRVTTVGVA